jgi:hypothetical protein
MLKRIEPNTDKLRYQMLCQIVKRYNQLASAKQFIHEDKFQKVLSAMSKFEQIFLSREKLKQDTEYLDIQKKAGMFLRHYLIVLKLAVERKEIDEKYLSEYGLKTLSLDEIPPFNTAKQILAKAPIIFNADAKRIAETGKYINSPNLAIVKMWVEKFETIHQNHLVQTNKYLNNQEFLQKLQREADEAITLFWDTFESHYHEMEDTERIRYAEEFGLSYQLDEVNDENLPQTGVLFESNEITSSVESGITNKKAKKSNPSRKKLMQVKELQSSLTFFANKVESC